MTGAQIASMARARSSVLPRPSTGSRIADLAFRLVMLASIAVGFAGLAAILFDVARDGLPRLSIDFLTNFPSRIIPERSGIQSALVGTLSLMVICAVLVVPLGIATAVYLEEYADREKRLNRLVEVNIQNLAAVPSVVYGILGLAFIVRGPLSMGRVLLAGGITLSLLVLPVVIIVAREAIRAVPPSIREGSLALGATQWQTIWKQVLPRSRRGHRDGRDPRALAGDRGDGAAADHRRGRLPALQPLRAVRLVHGAPDPDLQLDDGRRPGVRERGGRGDPRPDADPRAHELRRDLPQEPL